MSYLDVLDGLEDTLLGLEPGLPILRYAPSAMHRTPAILLLLDRAALVDAGQVPGMRFYITVRLVVAWQDFEQAENVVGAYIDAIADVLRANPTLGLSGAGAPVAEVADMTIEGQWLEIAGVTYRVIDFTLPVLEKRVIEMAEIPFEYLLASLETVRGTPKNQADARMNMKGTITPRKARYRPEESHGTLAQYYRSVDVRRWAEFEGEGALDVYTLPLLLNTVVAGGIDGSGAVAATLDLDGGAANTKMLYTAKTAGSIGNRISVQYIDPGVASSPLDIDVSLGRTILVYLATGGGGAISSTASNVKAAIEGHPIAKNLVTVAHSGGSTGAGTLKVAPMTYLSGGIGAQVETPGGATDARLWTFAPTMHSDDLLSMTMWWGDPNVQAFRSSFCNIDDMTIAADASGDSGVTLSISGQGRFPTRDAPTGQLPPVELSPMLMPAAMQLWVDDTDPIGTTEVVGRVVSAELSLPSGITRKWVAAGPGGGLDFQLIGRGLRHLALTVTCEVPDLDQYDQWEAGTSLAVRLRFNGPLIETGYNHYVEFDAYGPWDGMDWADNQGTNRTITLTLLSEFNDATGYDWCARVQSDRGTL